MDSLSKGAGLTPAGGSARWSKLFGMVMFCVLILMVLPLQAQDMSEQDLQNMYVSYLREEGYSPWVDDDGDVAFERSDLNFYIAVNEGDLEYFQLLFPGIYSIDTPEERQRAADAISVVNRRRKVAKIFMNTNETSVSVVAEVFLRNPGDFRGTFSRMFDNVLLAAQNFLEAMEE
ncbi:MAG: hypothetical protein LBD96_02820 [Treponema sp.]|jgi:hypothetical protein|nr:hypothetical protein [Treponema sp.]